MKTINEKRHPILFSLILACLMAIAFKANAGMYMFVEGVQGESTARGYEDWIDISSVQESMSIPVDVTGGAGGGSVGRVSLVDTIINKFLDRTSPFLRQQLTSGRVIPQIIIALTRTGGDGEQEYFRITLDNAYLTSVSMQGSGVERPTENVTMTCERIRWEYTPYNAAGTPGSKVITGWDFVAGRPL